ncbi:MAG TPA: hypothetical protein VFP33_04725 [Gallionella sp.]|nr:hypothetical protein [Gallionella sp.]
MRRLTFLFALVFAASAAAAERCGTDDFGNVVCMDKDGGVTTVRPDRVRGDVNGSVTTDASKGESGSKDVRDDKRGRPRCGIDPFGNKVCR